MPDELNAFREFKERFIDETKRLDAKLTRLEERELGEQSKRQDNAQEIALLHERLDSLRNKVEENGKTYVQRGEFNWELKRIDDEIERIDSEQSRYVLRPEWRNRLRDRAHRHRGKLTVGAVLFIIVSGFLTGIFQRAGVWAWNQIFKPFLGI